MRYEKKICAFIDVLGFRNQVLESAGDQEVFNEIIESLNKIQDFKSQKTVKRAITTFSDSIVISYDAHIPFIAIATDVMNMQKYFIGHSEMLLRGGVAFGDVVHTDRFLFGPAFIEAYELENKFAKYPRIILSNTITDRFAQAPGLSLERLMLNPSVHKKDDGDLHYYCHYLNSATQDDLSLIKEKVIQKIKFYRLKKEDNKIIEKWDWYLRYIESSILENAGGIPKGDVWVTRPR